MATLISCAAIIAVRNEAAHIPRSLEDYIKQGIDVVVVDNESTDSTIRKCLDFLGHGLLRIEHLPWKGTFDLSAQMEIKQSIMHELHHEWVIHVDADEWPQSPVPGESLIAGISRLDAAGYNAINFEEFVFLPDPEVNFTTGDYEKNFLNYYYFVPMECRLMRAWKRSDQLSNKATGGHQLSGNIRLAPETFILRHYIVLSYQHALMKYSSRTFSEADLKKGWHSNRLNLSADKLILPGMDCLKRLSRWDSKEFDRSALKHTHFWEW